MQRHANTTDTPNAPFVSHRSRLLRRALTLLVAGGIAAMIAMALPPPAAADGGGRRLCGNHVLRGDYGLLVTGIRAIGRNPDGTPITEAFIATSLRTYDGHGGFVQGGSGARAEHRCQARRAWFRDL
jgi:hypothetical protein